MKVGIVQALTAFSTTGLLLGYVHAQSIDPCLVGTWEATDVALIFPGASTTTGGSGFRVTFRPDGTEIVDYAAMKPFKWPPNQFGASDTQSWRGSATFRISTDRQTAKLESIEKTNVEVQPSGLAAPGYMPGGLGPGALGSTGADNGYVCTNESLEYKTTVGLGGAPAQSVKLARLNVGAAPLSADAGSPVAVHGRTWLTVTEIKDREQDLQGVWLNPDADPENPTTWLDPSAPGTLINHPVHQRNSAPAYIDMKQVAGRRWVGRVFICPQPKGTCPNLCRWVPGSMEFDSNNMSASLEWHDRKHKPDCSGLTDDPDGQTYTLKRLVGPSFVPILPGKYMELVGAPAVGNQASQFKAAVKLAARYDAMPEATVRAASDRGSITSTDKAAGGYEFVSDGSGVFELRFELSDAGGVFHTDRVRIEIPAIPGVGK